MMAEGAKLRLLRCQFNKEYIQETRLYLQEFQVAVEWTCKELYNMQNTL